METYRRPRLDPAYLELMDKIEETNSHTSDTASQQSTEEGCGVAPQSDPVRPCTRPP